MNDELLRESIEQSRQNGEMLERCHTYLVFVLIVLSILCLLVAIQIVAKIVIFARVIRVQERVELLLGKAIEHGNISDRNRERFASATEALQSENTTVIQAAEKVSHKIDDVAADVVTIKDKIIDGNQKEGNKK
jgi:hypothetical protein